MHSILACVYSSSEEMLRQLKACYASRYCSADGELYKDVEGVLEGLCNAISLLHGHTGQPLQDTALAQGLLQFWDGICCLFSTQAKPNHWLQQLLKALKLFEPEARAAAAGHVLVSWDRSQLLSVCCRAEIPPMMCAIDRKAQP